MIYESVWVVVGAAVGGLIRELVGRFMDRPTELRTEIEGLRAEIHSLNDELRKWKAQFYYLLDASIRRDEKALHKMLGEYALGSKEDG